MRPLDRLSRFAFNSCWSAAITALVAVLFVGWVNEPRAERVRYVTQLARPAQPAARAALREDRQLIVPERAEPTFSWLTQAQEMLAGGEARPRHVRYENAPFGRELYDPSPYRWWVGALARVGFSAGDSAVYAVERAALWADPLIHVLLIVSTTLLVARWVSPFAGVAAAVLVSTLFPFAAGYVPGVLDHHGLARAVALVGLVTALIAVRAPAHARRWRAISGTLVGVTLWIDTPIGVSLALAVIAGVVTAQLLRGASGDVAIRERDTDGRVWQLAGGASVLIAYLLEAFPDRLGAWHLETLHPLYGLAWIGAVECYRQLFPRTPASTAPLRRVLLGALGLLAVAAVPLAMRWTGSRGFLATDIMSLRLTSQPGALAAPTLLELLRAQGFSGAVTALLLPLAVVIPAGWILLRHRSAAGATEVGFGLAALGVFAGFACRELSAWHLVNLGLVALVIALVALPAPGRWWRAGAVVAALAVLVPGLRFVLPDSPRGAATVLTAMEAQQLVERDLAHWLARQAGEPRPVVYAPPHETTTLCYYGDLRGLGTFDPDNRAGFSAALAIAGARTMEEVQSALSVRGVRYVVVPSWDPFFDDFAARYLVESLAQRTSFFVRELRRWNLPAWLQPLAYQMPLIPGFEQQSVLVFEVVEEQKPAVAAARLTEYLLEIGRESDAANVAEALRRFPGDCGALAARALVYSAMGEPAAFQQTAAELRARLTTGADRYLAWDRRISVATVLAQAQDLPMATEQLQRCVADLSKARLRGLSNGSLYRLLVLCDALQVPIGETALRQAALEQLPAELRKQL